MLFAINGLRDLCLLGCRYACVSSRALVADKMGAFSGSETMRNLPPHAQTILILLPSFCWLQRSGTGGGWQSHSSFLAAAVIVELSLRMSENLHQYLCDGAGSLGGADYSSRIVVVMDNGMIAQFCTVLRIVSELSCFHQRPHILQFPRLDARC